MQTAPQRAKFNRLLSLGILLVLFGILLTALAPLIVKEKALLGILLPLVFITILANFVFTLKYRRRAKILDTPFSPIWRQMLKEEVHFYNALNPEEQKRFEQLVQVFIAEKRITGVQTDIDDKTRLLVAASAIIPVFGFKEWEYDNLGEVLIYANSFDKGFNQNEGNRRILGMVGNGPMEGIMILSKPALFMGFQNPRDGKNTGIHEFVHLIDYKDGVFDGLPALLNKQYSIPWLNLMHDEMEKIHSGESEINPYGGSKKVEFFAVASEYFFERPGFLKKEHPELYQMLQRIFHQDTASRFVQAIKEMTGYQGKRLGRNDPCPCDSGKKYKKCCLD